MALASPAAGERARRLLRFGVLRPDWMPVPPLQMARTTAMRLSSRPGPGDLSQDLTRTGGMLVAASALAMTASGLKPINRSTAAIARPPEGHLVFRKVVSQRIARAQRTDWPILAHLPDLAGPPRGGEPAALARLRLRPDADRRPIVKDLAALPALGAGTPIPGLLRPALEHLFRRDLGNVRLHTSAVVSQIGPEAFTTGRHVVFAPGRKDAITGRGLPLLVHELAHVGQVFALKTSQGSAPAADDAAENEANRGENSVRRIVEQGWPEPGMVLRRLAACPSTALRRPLSGRNWPATASNCRAARL